MSKFNISLSAVNTNGRGLDNAAATAARSLGYRVTGASTSSKFVEVVGSQGTTLLAHYGSWGGHQLEVASASLVPELIADLRAAGVLAVEAPKSNGRRVAIGGEVADLKKALTVIIGGPVKAEAEQPKAEAPKAVQAPLAAIQAPVVVEAPKAPALDVTAITVAALAAGKTTDEVLAIIAALK